MILVTGAGGQLGRSFCRQLSATGLSRSDLDISDEKAVHEIVARLRPEVIINCAAYTAVDMAEDEPDRCFAINCDGVLHLARVATELDCLFVQISTDYVFFGEADDAGWKPYTEQSDVNPMGVYANSKRDGEIQAATCPNHLIIRTCGLYGHGGNNFVETMLRLGKSRDELRVVSDQYCNPTSTETVVNAVAGLAESSHRGVFHIVNAPGMTWYDFAKEIFRQSGLPTKVIPITSAEFGARAPRPSNSMLDTTRYTSCAKDDLPTIPDALRAYLRDRV